MRREDRVRLRHMLDATNAALRFVEGKSRADLDHDEMLLFALVRAVEVIGEAAGKVSADGRAEMPAVRWSAIVGMRNRLVHAYFDIDRNVLWATVNDSLPEVKAQLVSWSAREGLRMDDPPGEADT